MKKLVRSATWSVLTGVFIASYRIGGRNLAARFVNATGPLMDALVRSALAENGASRR